MPITRNKIVLNGKTMGTMWHVSVVSMKSIPKLELQEAIQKQLDYDENELSTWKKTSLLSRLNKYHGTKPQPISTSMADIISKALRIGHKTNGAMNIAIDPLVNLWGFGPTKQPKHTPSNEKIILAKSLTKLNALRIIESISGQWLQKDLPNLSLDLSSMGEGYATDHLAYLMESMGITDYLVSVGGAVLTKGFNDKYKSWQVAIQKPTDLKNIEEARVELKGHGISTAGTYRNYYKLDGKSISHIINPNNGRPIENQLVSATVIASTALEADGWDTGLMAMGYRNAKILALKEHLAVYLIIKEHDNFIHWISPQFKPFLILSTSNFIK